MKIMKRQITSNKGMENKTIKRISYLNDMMFIFFMDDTFCVIDTCQEYDQNPEVFISQIAFSTNPDDYDSGSINALETLGLIDRDELNRLLEIKRPIDIENLRQKELKQLSQLKKKYEKE